MDGWGRVIAAVIDRRAELGLTQKELAAAAGVSERTIQSLEGGSRPQAPNRHKIEKALGWRNGEMRRIEEADSPRTVPVPPEVARYPGLAEDIRRRWPDPADQAAAMAEIAATLRGEPPPPTSPGAADRYGDRRSG